MDNHKGATFIAALAVLRENGCDEIEGYLFNHPLSAEEFLKFLIRERKETGIGKIRKTNLDPDS